MIFVISLRAGPPSENVFEFRRNDATTQQRATKNDFVDFWMLSVAPAKRLCFLH
jgi:hypothetical protein